MDAAVPRLRMFAGPNGSGKSTINRVVRPEILGTYINPDEIGAAMTSDGGLDFETFGLVLSLEKVRAFFDRSEFLRETGTLELTAGLTTVGNALRYPKGERVGYLASALADYLRREMLLSHRSFAFETVMSSRDKVDLLREAQAQDYRTYLYFVATEDPRINVSRVASRVLQGGHDVPEEKILSRYQRCLDLLAEAVYYSNRAYFFDNSTDGTDRVWIAEVGDDRILRLKTRNVPAWFDRYVIQKMAPGQD